MSSLGISTSRPPWLLQRLREGYVLVRNVRNLHQVSRIELTVETVAGIVFWTKNSTQERINRFFQTFGRGDWQRTDNLALRLRFY